MPTRIIDADTHIDESEATWLGLDEAQSKYRPITLTTAEVVPGSDPDRPRSPLGDRWWLTDGKMQPRQFRDERTHPARGRRELDDVPGRIQHMDELGVDIQVLFPTFFIRFGSTNPDAEYALTTAYNRWLAARCATSNGRLHWVCVLPFLQPDKAVQELRWAEANGACGVFKRGFDLDRPVSDRHFFPVYEEAAALDLPICIHTGHPLPGREWDRGFPVIAAVNALLTARIPERFPKLRFGLLEAGASWIPYALSQIALVTRQKQRFQQAKWLNAVDHDTRILRDNRLFVTLDPLDDVPYLLTYGAEDNLMIGTDYGHSDVSANLNAFAELRQQVDAGRITAAVCDKILSGNARRLYGL